jgi:hypothetical protein
MITKQPWFGPKQYFGWGWTPITWQGWAVTGLYLAVLLAGVEYFATYLKDMVTGLLIAVGSTAIYLVIIALTGTKPGGPGLPFKR